MSGSASPTRSVDSDDDEPQRVSLFTLITQSTMTKHVVIVDKKFNMANGLQIPTVGYGTWLANDEVLEKSIDIALQAGYRHIDTAHVYDNEKAIGNVLNRWFTSGKLMRRDIFLVTKLPPGGNRPESVPKYFQRSLDLLQVDYVDLYLVHVPFGFKDVEGNLHPRTPEGKIDMDLTTDHIALWKAMEDLVDQGKARGIGLSNFNKSQVSRILQHARIPPCNLQVEMHLYNQQPDLLTFCRKHRIQLTAYSPLGSPGLGKFMSQLGHEIDLPDILSNPVVLRLARKYYKTPAQLVLRHTMQKGIAVIPKSTNRERIEDNIMIHDIIISDVDMKELDSLDQGLRILDFSVFTGIEDHPEYPFK